MTRSIGDKIASTIGVTANPEIIAHNLSAEDKFLVIASDGIWEFLSN
jgi:serine/threonine protein phosphatase PrpC